MTSYTLQYINYFIILGVGKTSLIVNFIGKTISPLISPTIGASFFSCKINFDDSKVKLQVKINSSIYIID